MSQRHTMDRHARPEWQSVHPLPGPSNEGNRVGNGKYLLLFYSFLSVSWVFPGLFPMCFLSVSRSFQVFGLCVSWVFPGHFRSFAYVFPECFLGILGLLPMCFLSVSRSFHVFCLCVSWVFPGVFRSFGGVFPECFLVFRYINNCHFRNPVSIKLRVNFR